MDEGSVRVAVEVAFREVRPVISSISEACEAERERLRSRASRRVQRLRRRLAVAVTCYRGEENDGYIIQLMDKAGVEIYFRLRERDGLVSVEEFFDVRGGVTVLRMWGFPSPSSRDDDWGHEIARLLCDGILNVHRMQISLPISVRAFSPDGEQLANFSRR